MRFVACLVAMLAVVSANANDLSTAINNAQTACTGITDEINNLKKMAGINTAVTGVGTVAAGVALGAGLTKSYTDEQIAIVKAKIKELALLTEEDEYYSGYIDLGKLRVLEYDYNTVTADNTDKLEKLSKTLGNIRTGTLAASTATNIAGVVIAKSNKVDDDLKSKIDNCIAAVKTVSATRMQARIDGSATDAELARAEKIVSACGEWETVDITPINKRSTGAAISSGLGVGLGLAGTITSIQANKATENVEQKNKTANILAGGTTAASAAATIFNATQISAIKRVATVADNCMEALQ